jgi:hypothetical protein
MGWGRSLGSISVDRTGHQLLRQLIPLAEGADFDVSDGSSTHEGLLPTEGEATANGALGLEWGRR